MTSADDLARDIVRYAFEHDVLTQHGMAGIRQKIEAVITSADELHRLTMERIDKLMDAKVASPEGAELLALASAVESYEKIRFPDIP